jgi:ATP-binding cassette subfamily B multidrug efflux pump
MHPLLRLAPLFRPQWAAAAACVAGLCAATALGLVGPWLVATAIDTAMVPGVGGELRAIAAAYFAVVVVQMAATWLSRVGIEAVAQRAMLRLKQALFDHLVVHDQAFFDHHASGRLITRVEGDTQALQVLFTEVVLTIPADAVLVIGMFTLLLARSPPVALLVGAVVPPYALAFALFRWYSPPLFLAEREVRARLTGFLAEHLRAMPMLQRFDREAWVRDRADTLNAEVQHREVAEGIATVVFFNGVFLVRALGFALVLWGGAWLVLRGTVSVGVLVMGLGYLRQMFNPLMRLSNNLSTIERARASAIRIAELLDRAPTIVDPPNPVAWPGLRGALRLEAVSFAYDPAHPVLATVDLEVPAGSRVGIVGATGSGKSTIVSLLLRFRDPTHGRITVDGVDLRAMRVRDVRRRVGLVLQDVQLFGGTVLENLVPDGAPAERAAAERACAVLGIELSLDATVQPDGANLSRGERQLLTFARALAGDPEILVLDEATSAVDPATESRVQRALERLQAGRTTVIVAHRLATVRDCELIVVLDRGRIVERGSHHELLAGGGAYAGLVRMQQSGEAA